MARSVPNLVRHCLVLETVFAPVTDPRLRHRPAHQLRPVTARMYVDMTDLAENQDGVIGNTGLVANTAPVLPVLLRTLPQVVSYHHLFEG